MKKLFLTLTLALATVAAWATDYTGTLTVTVNGESTTQNGVAITINKNADNTYNLSLNNFILSNGDDDPLGVGNINIESIEGANSGEITALYVDKEILIENGSDPSINLWYGPMLGPVPLKMLARFTEEYLAVDIDIDMQASLEQTINVKFSNTGNHFQLPNGDFEEWSSSNSITEPRHWHGFKSATGTLASSATSTLLVSDDLRSGTKGEHSAVVASKKVFGVIANGTITNGQLMAESTTAANTWNHSQMEENSTATDKYGDKFYMSLYAKPDAIKTWIKFSQGTPNNDYPYATFSAIAFNGEYYQDPEPIKGEKSNILSGSTAYTQDDVDHVASRVAGKAQNKQISITGWRELVVPFDYATYASNNAEARAILITASTNATPGKGSANDQVFLDDMELLYYANVTDIKYKGSSINGFNPDVKSYDMDYEVPSANDFAAIVEGVAATTICQIIQTENGYQAIVYAISADLATANAYVFNFINPAVTLEGVEFTSERKWATWYGDENLALPENVTAYIVTNINGDVATIQPTGYLPKTTGVLLYSETPASNVTALPYSGTANTFVNNMLEGSNNGTTINKGYVLYNNYFVLTTGGSLPAHRCYIPIFEDAPAAPSILKIGNSAITAITDIEATVSGKVRYYDLNGREVNENATGILIRRNVDGTVTKIVK